MTPRLAPIFPLAVDCARMASGNAVSARPQTPRPDNDEDGLSRARPHLTGGCVPGDDGTRSNAGRYVMQRTR
jgi:hypothetical protein